MARDGLSAVHLENLVVDAADPRRLGRFWEAVVGGERLTDVPEGFETRLAVADGPVLDLCFQRVPDPLAASPRLHVHVAGGAHPAERVARLLALGARRSDAEPCEPGATALADPEGTSFCVVGHGDSADDAHAADDRGQAGPIAALLLDSADPDRDATFWASLTGWSVVGAGSLRHPSGRGARLELRPEAAGKGADKNRLHLDLRLEAGDDADAIVADVIARGGRELLHPEWGALPWRFCADPSGNDFCLLPAPSQPPD